MSLKNMGQVGPQGGSESDGDKVHTDSNTQKVTLGHIMEVHRKWHNGAHTYSLCLPVSVS